MLALDFVLLFVFSLLPIASLSHSTMIRLPLPPCSQSRRSCSFVLACDVEMRDDETLPLHIPQPSPANRSRLYWFTSLDCAFSQHHCGCIQIRKWKCFIPDAWWCLVELKANSTGIHYRSQTWWNGKMMRAFRVSGPQDGEISWHGNVISRSCVRLSLLKGKFWTIQQCSNRY